MRRHHALTAVLTLVALSLLSACGSSDNQTTQLTTRKASIVGTLSGDLADNMAFLFTSATDPDGTTLPLIIGETTWDDTLSARIKTAFDAGRPVALVNASPVEIDNLRQIAGFQGAFVLPESFTHADCYAIDRDNEGDMYEIAILPNLSSMTESTYIYHPNQTSTLIDTRTEMVVDTEIEQQRRAVLLGIWIGDDAARDAASTAAKAAAEATAVGTDLAEIAKSTETAIVQFQGRNAYQVINNVWTFYDPDNKESYFYVRQRGIFAAAPEFTIDRDDFKCRFASQYKLRNYVPKYLNDIGNVMIIVNIPKTYEGKIAVDEGIDYKFDGKVSLALKDGSPTVGGDLSAGIAIKHSMKYDINDVTVTNLSGASLNDTAWKFAIRWPDYRRNNLIGRLSNYGPVPEVGKGTFQPSTEWVWRVKDQVKNTHPAGLPITTHFYAELASRMNDAPLELFYSYSWDRTFGAEKEYTMSVPWPPTTPAPMQ